MKAMQWTTVDARELDRYGRARSLLGWAIPVIVALISFSTHSMAVDYTWTGGGADSDWTTVGNWDAVPVAGTGNNLIFDGTTGLNPNNDYAAGSDFSAILFAEFAGNFTLGGNGVTLNSTVLAVDASAGSGKSYVIDMDLDFAGAGRVYTVGNTLTLNGVLSGTFATRSFQAGTVYLTHPGNSFTGALVVYNAGTLSASGIANAGVNSQIGSGNYIRFGNASAGGTLEYTGAAASTDRRITVGNGNDVSHTGGGTIKNDGTGALTFTAGEFILKNATTAASRPLTLRGVYAASANVIEGIISDNNTAGGGLISLIKNDAGTWRLEGANDYSGTTTVTAGTLVAAHAGALGTTDGGTTVSSGATLGLQGGITTAAEALSITGVGVGSGGALRNLSGDNAYAGTVTLAGAASVGSDAGNLTISGQVTGAQALTVVGSGTVTLSNTGNDFTGLVIDGGTLRNGASGVINDTAPLTLKSGTWDLNGFDETLSGSPLNLGGAAGSAVINTGSNKLTLNGPIDRCQIVFTAAGNSDGAVINGYLEYQQATVNHFQLVVYDSPNATEDLTINAVLSNGGPADTGIWFTHAGATGTIVLNGANTFDSGSLQLRGGTVVLGVNDYSDGVTPGALGMNDESVSLGFATQTATPVALLLKAGVTTDRQIIVVEHESGDGTTTRTLGGYDTTGNAVFSGNINMNNVNSGGGKTLLQALGDSTVTFSGIIADGTDTVGVEKIGSGTVILTRDNTYKGATTVSAGTLVVDGIYSAPGLITVKGDAVLGGVGTVGAITVESTGTLAPGNSIGEMEGTTLTLDGGSILAWELDDNGSDSDLLTLSGGLTQGSGTGWSFDFLGTGAVGTYTLIKFASTDFTTGDFGITGLKDGYSAPDGVVVNTSLSEVQLTVIPEPASLGALGMIALAALLRRRLRR